MSNQVDEQDGEKPRSQSSAIATCADSLMNLSLLDPPRWGWPAVGAVTDLLVPHERAARRSASASIRKQKKKRASGGVSIGGSSLTNGGFPIPQATTPTAKGKGERKDRVDGEETAAGGEVAAKQLDEGESSTPEVASNAQQTTENGDGGAAAKMEQKEGERSKVKKSKPAENAPKKFHSFTGKINIGVEYLGMTISKPKNGSSSSSKDLDPKESNGETPTTPRAVKDNEGGFNCEINAIQNGVLDMYSYHRGREGLEPRDSATGGLLCAHPQTDTNCDWDAPKLGASVVVQFPLEDETDTKSSSGGKERMDRAIYRETISWDLADPNTPTPLAFATDIAADFGLSFGQKMELAMSIQQQLDTFIHQNVNYSVPLALKDPQDDERRFVGPPRRTHCFGQVLQTFQGGSRSSRKVSEKRQRTPPPSRTSNRSTSAGNGSYHGSTSSRRKAIEQVKEVVHYDEPEADVEIEYVEEVQRRSKLASIADVASKPKNGSIGVLEKKEDYHCHICHKRSKVAYIFSCGMVSHAYCEMHCRKRLNIGEGPDGLFRFDYCPICSLHCHCSKCRRKVETVARDLKRVCDKTGAKLKEAKFEEILGRCERASHNRSFCRPVAAMRRKSEAETVKDAEDKKLPAGAASRLKPPSSVPQGPASTPTVVGEGVAAAAAESAPSHLRKPAPTPATATKVSRPRKSSGSTRESRTRPMVLKPPLSDFPREVHECVELEPGTPDDFLKVYTAQGSYSVEEFPPAWSEQAIDSESEEPQRSPDGEAVDDGNVDTCCICGEHGNLLCCDVCPRAFHADCMKGDGQLLLEKKWECFVCQRENQGLPSDLVTGKKSLDMVCATFLDMHPQQDNIKSLTGINCISMIHEMISVLMEYDYGHIFSAPVDLNAVVGYREAIETPLDLGTIRHRLVNGDYNKYLVETCQFDDILIKVLCDIELVWHNCFTFNLEGSSIYRMAELLRRRARAICERSFDRLLSDKVKVAVQDYVHACEVERGSKPRNSTSVVSSSAKEKEMRLRRPRGKHKITVKVHKAGSNRPVGVLDPVTGRLVKIYSTLKTAGQAAQILTNLGHSSEWNVSTDFNAKTLIHRGCTDPSLHLFGYRWVALDELRAGKVAFARRPTNTFEMRGEKGTYVFSSVEEALSSPSIPRRVNLSELRDKLVSLEEDKWVQIDGLPWRRSVHDTDAEHYKKVNKGKLKVEHTSSLVHSQGQPSNMYTAERLKGSVIVRSDLVTNRSLVGFENVHAAFEDWTQCVCLSPSFPDTESTTMRNFMTFYLDGDRNIDGLVWRTVHGKESLAGQLKNGTSSMALTLASASTEGTNNDDTTAIVAAAASVEGMADGSTTFRQQPASSVMADEDQDEVVAHELTPSKLPTNHQPIFSAAATMTTTHEANDQILVTRDKLFSPLGKRKRDDANATGDGDDDDDQDDNDGRTRFGELGSPSIWQPSLSNDHNEEKMGGLPSLPEQQLTVINMGDATTRLSSSSVPRLSSQPQPSLTKYVEPKTPTPTTAGFLSDSQQNGDDMSHYT